MDFLFIIISVISENSLFSLIQVKKTDDCCTGVLMNRILKPVLSLLLLVSLFLLSGCEFILFDPKGPIGDQQKTLIIVSFWVMMIVVIPVFIMTVVFAIRYRSNTKKAEYDPHWEHSNKIEAVVWSVPLMIIIALGIITYITSHTLDPREPIASDKKPVTVQVVALDWKWLFIYPEYEVATINEMAMPVDTPVEFLITSDTVMNSFFIPQLGSQIYAMAGMENRLFLMADEPGTYKGISANYSGFGFSGMKFNALAVEETGFEQWLDKVRQSPETLGPEQYKALLEKSRDHQVEYFAAVNPLLFNQIIEKYTGVQNGQ